MIRGRIEAARDIQRRRFSDGRQSESRRAKIGAADLVCNADMRVGEIRQYCKLDGAGESPVRAAMGQMNLSAQVYHRVLKLARTIADLAGCKNIGAVHIAEALQYRPRSFA